MDARPRSSARWLPPNCGVRGAPLAYAVGRASFRHLTLEVDQRVLIPRPETEQLVELVLEETAATRVASRSTSASLRLSVSQVEERGRGERGPPKLQPRPIHPRAETGDFLP